MLPTFNRLETWTWLIPSGTTRSRQYKSQPWSDSNAFCLSWVPNTQLNHWVKTYPDKKQQNESPKKTQHALLTLPPFKCSSNDRIYFQHISNTEIVIKPAISQFKTWEQKKDAAPLGKVLKKIESFREKSTGTEHDKLSKIWYNEFIFNWTRN